MQGAVSISQEAQGSAATGHIAQRSAGHWEAGAGDVRSSRKKAGSLAGSGPIVSTGWATRRLTGAGLTVSWQAAGWFTADLLAIVHDPGLVLAAAGPAENTSMAHIVRAECNGRGERNMTGISKGSQAVAS